MAEKILIVSTTFPSAESARAAGAALVRERLAACAQAGGAVESFYRWRGAEHSETEHGLVLKTTRAALEPLKKRLLELHPYECPEFVAVEAEASDAYAAWVAENCGGALE